jgi:glucose-6-phosphate isomerase
MKNILKNNLNLSKRIINKKIEVKKDEIFEEILKEKEDVGYYNLPFQDITHIQEYAKTVQQKHICILGIGGSSLGSYAIYKFLKESKQTQKYLHFFESTDPIDIRNRLKKIDLDDALFIVISKSGVTTETISLFKYFHSLVEINRNNCVIITEEDSKLNNYAKENSIKTFFIPKNVGGRFSVFSVVGLVPLAIVGIDIQKLLDGAKEVYDGFFSKQNIYDELLDKAFILFRNRNQHNINVVFSYSSELEGFNKWYVQLWAESLGKISKENKFVGLTPLGLIGPVDQHSFLQLIVQGRRDKTVTVIKVDDFNKNTLIPDIKLKYLESLDCINNIEFAQLINYQADATIQTIKSLGDIPLDIINIQNIDEKSIAKLMYSYELLTSIMGQYLNINTYDQPGVEMGKIILKKLMKG